VPNPLGAERASAAVRFRAASTANDDADMACVPARSGKGRLQRFSRCPANGGVSAHLAPCRALQRSSPFRSHSGHSSGAVGTGLHAPEAAIAIAGTVSVHYRDNESPLNGDPSCRCKRRRSVPAIRHARCLFTDYSRQRSHELRCAEPRLCHRRPIRVANPRTTTYGTKQNNKATMTASVG
jgi:hypothetical protein